jgi:hypothetical protein
MKHQNSVWVNGGARPTGTQVTRFLLSTAYGFVNPVLGIISGDTCFFVD